MAKTPHHSTSKRKKGNPPILKCRFLVLTEFRNFSKLRNRNSHWIATFVRIIEIRHKDYEEKYEVNMKKRLAIFTSVLVYCFVFAGLAAQLAAQQPTKGQQPQAKPQAGASAAPQQGTSPIPEIVANVNGETISKKELTSECLRQFGSDELKDMVKRKLVSLECQRHKIVITEKAMNDEIVRMANACNFSTAEWLELIQRERNVTYEQLKSDIIWTVLAIGELARPKITITEEEIQKEFNARYGPGVQVRQIVLKSQAEAEVVLAEVRANPESFPSVAKNKSLDPVSRPFGGMIQPIRRNSLIPQLKMIEDTVFALKVGEISNIVQTPIGEHIIFRCEQHFPSANVEYDIKRKELAEKIRDIKRQKAADEVFSDIQDRAQVEEIYGNQMLMAQRPGIAAMVNGQPIAIDALAEQCANRFGKTVLSTMIDLKIVDQACRREKITITNEDIDAEIRQMALTSLPMRNGQPDVEGWIKLATSDGQTPFAVYRTNTIWAILALKRLTANLVGVTNEDIRKAYEATFGPRVQCLAIPIALKDHRRALEAWNLANANRTKENFSEVAKKYSYDAEIGLAGGVIPAIARHHGQPVLEEKAFALKPGEISEITQVDDFWVILFCIGHEEQKKTNLDEVSATLHADIFEKKQKVVIAQYYETLHQNAIIMNHLTGEMQDPREIERQMKEAVLQSAPATMR